MRVVIMRGVPGAGKSTRVKAVYGSANAVSADDHFIGPTGVYRFNASELGEAHGQCLRKFIDRCRQKRSLVVVDNTNIYPHDIAPYVAIGEAYGYEVRIETVLADPLLAAQRNIHGVPANRVIQTHMSMVDAEDDFPLRWRHQLIHPSMPETIG